MQNIAPLFRNSSNKNLALSFIFLFIFFGFSLAQEIPNNKFPNTLSKTSFIGKNNKQSFPEFGVSIQSATQLGETKLELSNKPVKINDLFSIAKVVAIHPKNNTDLEAELVFHYQDSELNGIDEDKLILYSSVDHGKTWQAHENSVVDTKNNTIRLEKLKHFSLWTAAVVLVPDNGSTLQNKPVTVNVLANDTGILSDAVLIVGVPTQGSAVVNTDRTITYFPIPSFFGTDTFVYAIDNNVQPTTAANDKFIVAQSASTVLNVLSNDFDPNSDPLTVTIITAPTNGSVVVNANNTVTYTPTGDYLGIDNFTYQIDDGNGHTDTATVQVTVYLAGGTAATHYLPTRPQTGTVDASSPIYMQITTNDPAGATGTISFPNRIPAVADIPFNITRAGFYRTTLDANNPGGADLGITHTYNTAENKGIKIVANTDVQVGQFQDDNVWESYLNSKGQAAFGKDFYAGSMYCTRLFANQADMPGDFVSVMAVQDNTTVTIQVPTGKTWNWRGTSTQTAVATLNAGQTYVVRAPGTITTIESISGAHITSDKVISVSSGSFGVYPAGSAGDNGYDQLVPVQRVGKEYVIVRYGSLIEIIRVVATAANTVITFNGNVVATRNAGEVYQVALPGASGSAHTISATNPVYIYQTSGRNNDGEVGMALIAPLRDDGAGKVRFRSAASNPVVRAVFATSARSSLKLTRFNTNGTTTNIPITATSTVVASKPTVSIITIPVVANTNYELAADSFIQSSMVFAASGGGGYSAMSGFEDALVAARDDNYTVGKNIARVLNVLSNDTQAAGLPLHLGTFTQPSHGTVVKNANNTFTYTPTNNYLGTDEFTYIAQDADGNSSTATVFITITELDTTSVTIKVAKDRDNDGLSDEDDIDDDNDGIIDTAEGYCETTSVYTLNLNTTLSGATFGANGGGF